MVLRTPLEAALYVIVEGFAGRHIGNGAPAHLVGDRVKGEVGVYGRRPVPDQTGHVMNGPRFSRLHYEADVGAQFLVHQEMVDGGHQQQRRYGHGIGVRMPVRKDDHTGPAQDGIFDLSTDVVKGVAQSLSGARRALGREQAVDGKAVPAGDEPVLVYVQQGGQLVVRKHRAGQHDLVARPGPGSSRLPSGPTEEESDVMSSSLMASRGGLVTWAKSWRK